MPDLINTIKKMAVKRALVAAILIAVNASEFFTQDLDDQVVEGQYTVSVEPSPPPPAAPRDPNPAQQAAITELCGIRQELHRIGAPLKELTKGLMKELSLKQLEQEITSARRTLEIEQGKLAEEDARRELQEAGA